MVRTFWNKRQRRGESDKRLAEEAGPDETHDRELEETWSKQCRDSLIETAMARLEEYQNKNAGNVYYDALRMRSGFPTLNSAGLAK